VTDASALIEAVLRGDHQAAARLISMIENGRDGVREALRGLHPYTGRAYVVGVTGPPGSGKSTLVDALTRHLRREDRRVGIVAVDPSSPFTGGAILGDRIRMMDHSQDTGVFIRSMATRGSLGGLSRAATDVVYVLDAMGCDIVFLETVGAGQAEVDVVQAADTVVVVTVPGLGDAVQTIKAGIMEIADVFVVNKADRPDSDRTITEIRSMLRLVPSGGWEPPVVRTVATANEGVANVADAIERHRSHLEAVGALAERRLRRRKSEILKLLEARLRDEALRRASGRLDDLARRVASGEMSPYEAAEEVLWADPSVVAR
jgi:LAO/AO transport system kinase